MKFGNPQNSVGSSPTTQTEEVSVTEKVALAKLENDLMHIKQGEALPETNIANLSNLARKRCEDIVLKAFDSQIKKETADGLILGAKMLSWIQISSTNSERAQNFTACNDRLKKLVVSVFEKYLSSEMTYMDDLKGLDQALALREYFQDEKINFALICEAKKEKLKKHALTFSNNEFIRSIFSLVPGLEDDTDLRENAKKKLSQLSEKADDYKKIGGLVQSYPKSFFTFDEKKSAAMSTLEHQILGSIRNSKDFNRDHILVTYSLSPEERDLVAEQLLDKKLNHAYLNEAKQIAEAFNFQEALKVKAQVLYKKLLSEDKHNSDTVIKLDSIVTDEFKAQDEIINLKRSWAIKNLEDLHHYLSRRGKNKMDEQFNLSEEFISQPESQQKIQEQVLVALARGNYYIAVDIYKNFLNEPSKSDEFREQLELAFLKAIKRVGFSFTKDSEEVKLLELCSDTFKQSAEFRHQAQKILSEIISTENSENIIFAIDALKCSEEEITKAKERSLLKIFAYISENGKISIKRPEDRTFEKLKALLQKTEFSDSVLNSVRSQLNDSALQNKSLDELQSLRWYARGFNMSDSEIISQEIVKEVVCKNIEDKIQNGEINNAISIGREFKLTPEDIKKINQETLIGGITWWLQKELDSLESSYNSWKHANGDIDTFIEFFNIPQESLFLNQQIKKIGGNILLAGQLNYNLENSGIGKTLKKTLLITEEDMVASVDRVLRFILEKEHLADVDGYLKKITAILPSIQPGFADQVISDFYLENMASYDIPKTNSSGYGRRDYNRNHSRNDISDKLVGSMNLLKTFEAKKIICTQTFVYLVSNGNFDLPFQILSERNGFQFVDQEIRQECLLPEYIRLLTEYGEREADSFANNFEINVTNVNDDRVTEAYQNLFKNAILKMNIRDIIDYSLKVNFSKEFINSPEIKSKLEAIFIENLSHKGLEVAVKLVEGGLLDRDFIKSERVQKAAKLHIPQLLLKQDFEGIVALSSQLALGTTPQEIVALDPERIKFFEKISIEFPKLYAKCMTSLDALFSIWKHVHLLDSGILEKFPFLAEALQENERFGVKLLLKFQSLDKLSQANIQTLYKNKSEIVSERSDGDVDSYEFRASMQSRLMGYRRNTEIVETLLKSGITVEQWLNYNEETFFTLGRDESLKFSETIVTPIERIQETINGYTETVKEVLEQYKKELMAFKVPLKDANALNGELKKLTQQKQIALQNGDTRKAEGIAKGISGIESQILNIKDIPLWDKVFSSIALLDLVKKDIFNAYDDLCKAEINLEEKENDTNIPTNQKGKDLIKIKNKIDLAKKEMQKKVQLLGTRLAEFDNDLYNMTSPAIGDDRAESLIQEKNELVQEHVDHYQSDSKTLENLFYEKEDNTLAGQHMKIGVWSRNPDRDLYLGNYTDCCIRIDSSHMGAECTIADYLTDLGVQIVSITDEKKNIPVAVAWCWIGHDDNDQISFVVDNIEANTDYSSNYKAQLETKLKEYLQNYAKQVNAKLVQGTKNNDLTIAGMDSAYFKLGGYNRPSGYFLEGEDDRDGFHVDEHEHDHWDDDN